MLACLIFQNRTSDPIIQRMKYYVKKIIIPLTLWSPYFSWVEMGKGLENLHFSSYYSFIYMVDKTLNEIYQFIDNIEFL